MTTPYRLWSLRDMLKVYAHRYINLGQSMESASMLLRMIESEKDLPDAQGIQDDEREDLRDKLKSLKSHCEKLGLSTSFLLLEKAINDVPQTSRELEIYLSSVDEELKGRLFFYVPWERARYYEDNVQLNAQMVVAFPKASREILHSGNCYATGEYTASVFHAMRATDLALKAVATHLNVPATKPIGLLEWTPILNLLDAELEKLKNAPRTEQREFDQRFYGDANSQFVSFKDAFRNHVSHARGELYEELQSIGIYHRVTGFLEVLSARVSEPA